MIINPFYALTFPQPKVDNPHPHPRGCADYPHADADVNFKESADADAVRMEHFQILRMRMRCGSRVEMLEIRTASALHKNRSISFS